MTQSMIIQTRALRISSKAKRLLAKLKRARSREDRLRLGLAHGSWAVMLELLERDMHSFRRALLFELANLHEAGCGRFRRQWRFLFGLRSDKELLSLRDELREVWDARTSQDRKHLLLRRWLAWQPSKQTGEAYSAWEPILSRGLLVPDHHNLHAQLAFAALEHARRFACCKNEGCPARFFLAKRRTQKYCERGDCLAHAQREYALKWWRKKEEQRRRQEQSHRRSKKLKAKARRKTREGR